MALHDYQCWHDGTVLADQFRPIDEGAQANPPLCPTCGNRMVWIPQISRMDLLSENAKFEMFDGQNRPVKVETFAQMHAIERQSEQDSRNGEGSPLRFRALHQIKGNMQSNTFGDGPPSQLSPEGKKKFGLQGATRQIDVDTAESRAYGPGVNDSNTSALKD